MAYDVKFLRGTAEKYATITKDQYTFYLVGTDLYLGEQKLNNAAEIGAAVSRIATNEGDIVNIKAALETIQGADTVDGSIRKIVKDAVAALDNQLAAVAKSGAAADVSVADAAGKLDSANVEAALNEIVGMVEAAGTAGAITMTHEAGTLVYDLYQGGNDASHKVGSIVIPEDMVATKGELVHEDDKGATGTFIKMTIANADPFYINVTDLIEYNDVDDTAEIALDNTNHVITATIVEMNGSKLVAGSVAKAKLDSSVQASLDLADSAVQSVAEGATNGTVAVDGTDVAVHGLGSAAYTAATAYDVAGAAAAAKAEVIGESTDTSTANTIYGAKAAASAADTKAQSALDLIGTIPSTSEADTVIEYVNEQTAGGVAALNGSAGIASVTADVVTLKAGVTETAGIIDNSSDADIVLAKAAKTGAAVD